MKVSISRNKLKNTLIEQLRSEEPSFTKAMDEKRFNHKAVSFPYVVRVSFKPNKERFFTIGKDNDRYYMKSGKRKVEFSENREGVHHLAELMHTLNGEKFIKREPYENVVAGQEDYRLDIEILSSLIEIDNPWEKYKPILKTLKKDVSIFRLVFTMHDLSSYEKTGCFCSSFNSPFYTSFARQAVNIICNYIHEFEFSACTCKPFFLPLKDIFNEKLKEAIISEKAKEEQSAEAMRLDAERESESPTERMPWNMKKQMMQTEIDSDRALDNLEKRLRSIDKD